MNSHSVLMELVHIVTTVLQIADVPEIAQNACVFELESKECVYLTGLRSRIQSHNTKCDTETQYQSHQSLVAAGETSIDVSQPTRPSCLVSSRLASCWAASDCTVASGPSIHLGSFPCPRKLDVNCSGGH
jgi:hypothetical protein